MKILRTLQTTIAQHLFKGKTIVLVGARQVGKTTLLRNLLRQQSEPFLELNCDEQEAREALSGINVERWRRLVGNNKIVLIDEAQRVENIGIALKLGHDNLSGVQLLVSGSSALGLRDTINEPLTGRKFEFQLFPIATNELLQTGGELLARQTFESRLIYGSYPDILVNAEDAAARLTSLANDYLYKDILSLEGIRKPTLLNKLLVALALQVGSEVSYNELGQTVGSDAKTVEKYIDLLEKCFIVFRLQAFSRNLRTELKRSRKIYFYDNGVRNAVLNNFAPLTLRGDAGALWENFCVSERMKENHYAGRYVNAYFWRTTQQQEMDYIEEQNGRFRLFEMKWNPKKAKANFVPDIFKKTYDIEFAKTITPENYIDELLS